ncbi:hypothetical protein PS6_010286 [Mucor atramentarius]
MKLRDRQKRVLGDVKQEDNKVGLSLINTSSSTVNELGTWSREIKQEDTKNDSSLLKQDGKMDLVKKAITTNVIGASRECQLSSQCYNIAS